MNAPVCLIVFLSVWCLLKPADGLAVMSVDLGTEWMKIAIVSPGVPMEIVLNKESKRKTPIAVSFRDEDRDFGENAVTLGTRFPDKVYKYLLSLIGKKYDNPAVKIFRQWFPYYNIVADEERNTVLFQHDENAYFSVEELLGMILEKARDLAQDFAGQPIKDAVITVPAFFNQAERRAVKLAAELAGLKVLQLMSDNAAVALNYGIFRRKDFNSTVQRIMFFDMGSASTMVSIVGYQIVKTKEKGYAEDVPQLTILGVGYNRTLGGLELTVRLQRYFAQKFNEQKRTSTDVFSSPRAMAKLLKEAERVKLVLSANLEHVAQVESLIDDVDFKLPISRADFEALSEGFFEKIGPIIDTALKSAELTMDDIDQVILSGAGTRVPKIQEEILKSVKKPDLGKNLNTDEAAALGAVYQAAHLSQGFKVKRFIVKEAVLFPIQVVFERELEPKEGVGIKQVSRTLFGLLNPFPQKKVMTFNRHVKDFTMMVKYGNLGFLTPEELEIFGSQTIANISLSGVATALEKHTDDQSEYKGVKAHFKMDESGILTLDQVESVFDKSTVENEDQESESTLSRLGHTISQLFSGIGQGAEKDGAVPEDKEKPEEQSAEEPTSTQPPPEIPSNASDIKNDTIEAKNDTAEAKKEGADMNDTKPKTEKLKTVVVKEPIVAEEVKLDLIALDSSSLKTSKDKLKLYNDKEQAKKELEEAHNALESFILETKDKLYQPEYEEITTEDERGEIMMKLNEASDWLYEESDGAQAKAYKSKLSTLKSITSDMFNRMKEHRERPEAFSALKEMLNMSDFFLQRVKNASEDEQYFTETEISVLEKLIMDTRKWMEDMQEEQSKVPLHKAPAVTIRNIAEKIAALDREVKYMYNKARTAKPKTKAAKNHSESENTTSSEEETPRNKASKNASGEIPVVVTPSDDTQETQTNNQETDKDSIPSPLDVEVDGTDTLEVEKNKQKETGDDSKTTASTPTPSENKLRSEL